MSDPQPAVTLELARFVSELQVAAVPADVLHHAKRCLMDHLGVGLAGSSEHAARIARDVGVALAAGGEARVLGSAVRMSAPSAALANGVAAHVLDYDDTYNPGSTTVHGSAAVWPAVLASASIRQTCGDEALVAFLAGFETAVRLALAAGPSQYDVGWHVTGTVGHVGAAAAASRVLACDAEQISAALGTGATQAAGMKAVYGSMGKALHAGKAASDGVLSGLLARSGFTSSPVALEGHRGFLHLFSDDPSPELATEGIGDVWTVRENGFKAYACGSLTHPCIDAVISLRDEHQLECDEIVSVDLHVHDYVITTTGIKDPVDGLQGKFSIYHCVAVALVDGAARLAQFTDAKTRDPSVVEMRSRIAAHHDDTQTKDSAAVAITMADGRVLRRHVAHNKGTPGNPMSDDELEAKFIDLAGEVVGPDAARQIADMCWTLEDVADVTDLSELAAIGARP